MTDFNRDLAILAEKEILQKVTLALRSQAGPKRWFWELLQNALDTIADDDSRKINIEVFLGINQNGKTIMRFEHDGTPFQETRDPNKFDDFKNLILPMSGKKTSDTKTVGKFGTGFLSTHGLSTVIDVEGVFETKNGEKYGLSTTLDRTYFIDEDDKYNGLRIESIVKGLEKLDESRKSNLNIEDEKTRFTYYLNDEHAIGKAKTGLLDLEQSLPIVMALNKKIGTIEIKNELDKKVYIYNADKLHVYKELKIQNCLKLEGNITTTFSVAYLETNHLTICWPLEPFISENDVLILKDARKGYKASLNDEISIVYSTFPMIGSGDLQFPVIVHSSNFKPNEKRDGISLTDEIISTESGEKIELDKTNKELIEEAVNLYQKFLSIVSEEGENLAFAAKANQLPNKDWISQEWYKEHVIDKIRQIIVNSPLIDVSDKKSERKSILDKDGNIQVYFPSLKNGKDAKQRRELNHKLYIFSKHLYGNKIPLRKDLDKWQKVLWVEKELIRQITIEDIVIEVAELITIKNLSSKLKYSTVQTIKWLNHLYSFIEAVEEQTLFENYAILPNQKGIFKGAKQLSIENAESKIEPELICILRLLDHEQDYFSLLLHRSVKCNYSFSQKSLKDDVGPLINRLMLFMDGNKYYPFLSNPKPLIILRRLLSYKHETSRENTIREKVFGYNQDFFGAKNEKTIPYFKDFDISNALLHQIRIINERIENCVNVDGLAKHLGKSKENTLIWLNEYLNYQVGGQLQNLIDWANVIPNQYEIFKARGQEQDRERMYKPYTVVNNNKNDILDQEIIEVLKDLPPAVGDDWKQFLVHEKVDLHVLPSKTWLELGTAIDNKIKEINTQIVDDTEEQKALYLDPLLTLLSWFEVRNNRSKADEYFKYTFPIKDKLYLQLTYSPENVAVLKDKHTLGIAKALKASSVSSEDVQKTISYLEDIKSKFGEKAIAEFLSKAESFMSTKETFKNRLETGKNIEQLLKNTLEVDDINVDAIESNLGSFDLLVSSKTDMSKSLKIEIKSYLFGSKNDFRFANSQIIEANKDASNYLVCTLERPKDDAITEVEYLKNNIKVQSEFGAITKGIYPIITEFDHIYKQSLNNEIPLEIPCLEEPRVKFNQNTILKNTGSFNDLINIIKHKIL